MDANDIPYDSGDLDEIRDRRRRRPPVAKPKRKSGWDEYYRLKEREQLVVLTPKPILHPDTERLNALLRLLRELCPDRQFTRRSVDKLLKEKG